MEAHERVLLRWLCTRTNGNLRSTYGAKALRAARAARYCCTSCGFADVRALHIDHVDGRIAEADCACIRANCHDIKSANMTGWRKTLRVNRHLTTATSWPGLGPAAEPPASLPAWRRHAGCSSAGVASTFSPATAAPLRLRHAGLGRAPQAIAVGRTQAKRAASARTAPTHRAVLSTYARLFVWER